MDSYLQEYGVSDQRRNKVIWIIILSVVALAIVGIAVYFLLEDHSEKKKAEQFLAAVNAHNYKAAYEVWGCGPQHPCPNYEFDRFMEDWGPQKKASAPWQIVSTDSCKSFLTVNVRAAGADQESLSVQRSDNSLSFAPDPECQERKWRWKQFFQRFFGESPPPPQKPPQPGG